MIKTNYLVAALILLGILGLDGCADLKPAKRARLGECLALAPLLSGKVITVASNDAVDGAIPDEMTQKK
jgi:hypothetical protein